MGAEIQAFDIFQTPLSSHYPLPLREVLFLFFSEGVNKSQSPFNASEVAALFHPSYTHPEKPAHDEAPTFLSANQSAPRYAALAQPSNHRASLYAAYPPENPTNQQSPPYTVNMQKANDDAQLYTRPVKSTNQEVPLVIRRKKPANQGASMYTRPEKTANQGVPLYIPFYIKPKKSANKRAHSVDLSFTHDAPPTNTREQMLLLANRRHDLDGKHQLRLLDIFLFKVFYICCFADLWRKRLSGPPLTQGGMHINYTICFHFCHSKSMIMFFIYVHT
jgi:hypothetical protein